VPYVFGNEPLRPLFTLIFVVRIFRSFFYLALRKVRPTRKVPIDSTDDVFSGIRDSGRKRRLREHKSHKAVFEESKFTAESGVGNETYFVMRA